MAKPLTFAAMIEVVTGIFLLFTPSLVGRLLFGEDLAGMAIPVARLAGIALVALGVACWTGSPLAGMLVYNAAVALFLAYLGCADGLAGVLLWPAVALHVVVTALLLPEALRMARGVPE